MEKHKNIPALRFPEFEGEWEKRKIDDSIDLLTGYPFEGKDISEEPSGLPLMRGINISEGEIRHNQEIDRYYSGDTSNLSKYILREGDLVIGMDGSKVGKNSAFIDNLNSNSILVQRVARLRQVNNSSLEFIFHHINSFHFHNYVDKVKTSSGIPHISLTQIRDFSIFFPSITEQTRIASFLTAVDDKLKQLKKKKTLLEQYKKGVMQQLFSQQLRFKQNDGSEFPEWEEKRLGEIAVRITRKNRENNKNVLTISAQAGLVSQLEFFKKSVAAKNLTGYYLLEKDDFTYNKSYSKGYPMGAMKRLKNYQKGVVSTLYICFRFNSGVNLCFMEQYFENGNQNSDIEQIAHEGARNHGLLNIGIDDFFNIPIELPCESEQTKIANFLSAIDEKISHCQLQIEKMELWKKGLLQRMFC